MDPAPRVVRGFAADMTEAAALTLRCLAGRPCPEDVVLHARSATKLTPTAIEHLPEVLDPCVVGPMTQPLATALTQFSPPL